MHPKKDYWVYDLEVYPNVFLCTLLQKSTGDIYTMEISGRQNDIGELKKCVQYLSDNNAVMVGFNNIGYDYPVLHNLIHRKGIPRYNLDICAMIYDISTKQIQSSKFTGFPNTIKPSEYIVQQLDLFKINHFDNKAKATSLKMIEFNMRSSNIKDLPYKVGSELSFSEIDELIKYNIHDVKETAKFFDYNLPAIDFRMDLTKKYSRSFMNHNDTKIGKDYFLMELEKQGVPLVKFKDGKPKMNQSPRSEINLGECLFDYYDFINPELKAIYNWFKNKTITETKGVMSDILENELGEVSKYAVLTPKRKKLLYGSPSPEKLKELLSEHPAGWLSEEVLKAKKAGQHLKSFWWNWKVADTLNVKINNFVFYFGTGGVHGSLEKQDIESDLEYCIKDADVTSLYPNIAIQNRVYPEHLTEKFCDIYQNVFEMRKQHKKGSAENLMLKLALNGVYGDSNNQFSNFYDPKYTMTITINGQLSICMLAERLMQIPNCQLIQVNTDGVTVKIPRKYTDQYDLICKEWQQLTKLDLEFVDYSRMCIRDVNNYIAVGIDGKVKRKGAYQYKDLGWHQNQGGLVIPMAAEASILNGKDVRQFIREHFEKQGTHFDFMLRTKVPRSSRLELVRDGVIDLQQNICRYYVSNSGGTLRKVMPALATKPDQERILEIEKGWLVKTCNDIQEYDQDINIDYYVNETKKLLLEVESDVNTEDITSE